MNEFRRQVGEYINQTYYAGKAFTLVKGTKNVGALVPMAMIERLAELEALVAQLPGVGEGSTDETASEQPH